jgi:hypothetical protein
VPKGDSNSQRPIENPGFIEDLSQKFQSQSLEENSENMELEEDSHEEVIIPASGRQRRLVKEQSPEELRRKYNFKIFENFTEDEDNMKAKATTWAQENNNLFRKPPNIVGLFRRLWTTDPKNPKSLFAEIQKVPEGKGEKFSDNFT